MKKLLVFCLPVVLMFSCGKAKHSQLTLIFENAPENSRAIYESDSVSFIDKENTVKRLYWFDAENWLTKNIPQGANDTLRIDCGENSYIEFCHNYRLFTYHYVFLQTGDTVRIRYEEDGVPIYHSSVSESLTTLYNGDVLIFGKPPADFKDDLYYHINKSTSLEQIKKNGRSVSSHYLSLDSLLLVHEQGMRVSRQIIDSLVKSGIMSVDYERYYRYRLQRLDLEPEVMAITTPTLRTPLPLTPNVYAFLNNDSCRNISYWHIVGQLKRPLVYDQGNWEPPLHHFVDNRDGIKKERALYHEGAIFDRLALYEDSIHPFILNMMRYDCLMVMKNAEYQYSDETQQEYFNKYRQHTTDFLVPDYIPIQDTMRFPFRFFIFLLEFIICTGAFWGVYLSLLKDRISFLASRIYLLAALVLSGVISWFVLPVHLAILPDSALFWDSMLGSFLQLVFYVYLLGSLYMFTYFGWQLIYLRKMWKNSWRIPEGDYTLCILTELELRPFMFCRNIFFSWNDWWNVESKVARSQLLAHEVAHVKLWHSLDNLLLMVGRILYWANPLLLTYGKEIRRINEFAADRAVIRAYSKKSYIKALVETDPNLAEIRSMLANSNQKDYLERFEKMNAKPLAWYKNLRLLLIIPLVILLVLLFSSELLVNLGKLSAV